MYFCNHQLSVEATASQCNGIPILCQSPMSIELYVQLKNRNSVLVGFLVTGRHADKPINRQSICGQLNSQTGQVAEWTIHRDVHWKHGGKLEPGMWFFHTAVCSLSGLRVFECVSVCVGESSRYPQTSLVHRLKWIRWSLFALSSRQIKYMDVNFRA